MEWWAERGTREGGHLWVRALWYRVWRLWIRVWEGVAILDQGLGSLWHLWIRVWEGLAFVDYGHWRCGTCGSVSEKVYQFWSWSLNVWHLWNRICEGGALVDHNPWSCDTVWTGSVMGGSWGSGFVRIGHLWIRACEMEADKGGGTCRSGSFIGCGTWGSCSLKVWHLWIRVWEGVALVDKFLWGRGTCGSYSSPWSCGTVWTGSVMGESWG